MRLQNRSEVTVTDHLTQLQAKPGDVIEVDDDLAENYVDHPFWDVLPSYSLSTTTENTDTTGDAQ